MSFPEHELKDLIEYSILFSPIAKEGSVCDRWPTQICGEWGVYENVFQKLSCPIMSSFELFELLKLLWY